MTLLSRRGFLKAGAGAATLAACGSSYAFAIEPAYRLTLREWTVAPHGWPVDARPLRIAVLSDLHAFEPYMPCTRIARIVATTNALRPDITVLLGDFVISHPHMLTARAVPVSEWSAELGRLRAPLGVYAVLGNHDGYFDPAAVRLGLQGAGLPVLENHAIKLTADGHSFWLAGLGDQMTRYLDVKASVASDDLPGTLAQITDSDPLILLAHEPNIFAVAPPRVTLTLAGHTHGGQVWLPFYGNPGAGTVYDGRYVHGVIVENGRHLVVSAGLGTSSKPVRFMVPPEITIVNVGRPTIRHSRAPIA
jgi:uncharacterized protein